MNVFHDSYMHSMTSDLILCEALCMNILHETMNLIRDLLSIPYFWLHEKDASPTNPSCMKLVPLDYLCVCN